MSVLYDVVHPTLFVATGTAAVGAAVLGAWGVKIAARQPRQPEWPSDGMITGFIAPAIMIALVLGMACLLKPFLTGSWRNEPLGEMISVAVILGIHVTIGVLLARWSKRVEAARRAAQADGTLPPQQPSTGTGQPLPQLRKAA